jgi:hypothetical protein
MVWTLETMAGMFGRLMLSALLTLMWMAVVFCCGCLPSIPQTPVPVPKPIIVAPVTDDTPDDMTLTVTAADSLVATLHEIIGNGGSVTLNPAEPIVVTRPEATLTIKPGTVLTYTMTESGGQFIFSDPRPRVTAKVWGLKVSPELTRLDLNSDNTGTAHVQSGPIKLQKRFSLAWESGTGSTGTTAQTDEPTVVMYVTENCGYCVAAERVIAAAVMPVRVRIVHTNSGSVPSWVESFPTFHWQSPQGPKKYVGWPGVEELIQSWRSTQTSQYQGRTSNHWTFPGSTRADLIAHLQQGQHVGRFDRSRLDSMTFAELQQLHADDHEGVVNWQAISSRPTRQTRPPPRRAAS